MISFSHWLVGMAKGAYSLRIDFSMYHEMPWPEDTSRNFILLD